MTVRDVLVPELGNFSDVPVIDIVAAAGDTLEVDSPLITLETDKASMDVPSPVAGKLVEITVRKGDTVSAGSLIARVEVEASTAADTEPQKASGEAAPNRSATQRPVAPDTAGARAQPAATHASAAAPFAPAPAPSNPAAAEARASRDDKADRQVQLLVLGAGPGGYTAAFRAADLGQQVLLVDRWASLGGVCLNVGCIPSKALLHAAKVIDEAKAMSSHGIAFNDPTIDVTRLRDWKSGVVRKLTGGLKMLAKQRKVEVVQGTGRFVSPHVIEIAREGGATERVRFEQCIVAAGSEVLRLPMLPDDPRVIDSTGALDLADIPQRLLVIGGGIIGLEMACVYAALGSRVTVVELTPQLMPGADADLVKPLEKRLKTRYEKILLGTRVTAVAAEKNGLRVTFEGAGDYRNDLFDRVLTAVGRVPNGKAIGAEAAGVHVDERGHVPVDRQQRTNVPHIFAIGDIVGQPMLAHKATHEAKVAAEVAAGHKRALDARVIPSVAYTDPEVAWVGLTEIEARKQGVAFKKGLFPWMASGRSLSMARDEGFTKLLFDPATRRVLGGGIVGPNAGELIAEVALAIETGADAADIGLTIHPHPTLSETVALAAEAFEGTLTDLYIPKR